MLLLFFGYRPADPVIPEIPERNKGGSPPLRSGRQIREDEEILSLVIMIVKLRLLEVT